MSGANRIAVFTKNRINPAYAGARLAADRVAREAGAATIHFVPETPDDVGQQKLLVRQALAMRPTAVIFVPVDDAAMVEELGLFAAAGIPVVLCINRMPGQVVTFVGSDDVAVGRLAAEALFHGMAGKGAVLALHGAPAAPTSRDRGQGLQQALASFPGIRLAAEEYGYYQQQAARALTEKALRTDKVVDGVWAANDVMAFGAIEALQATGRRVPVVGVNGLAAAIDCIEAGTMLATVDFSAFTIAAIATWAALRHLAGAPVPATILIPTPVIDRTNFCHFKGSFEDRPCPAWEEVVPRSTVTVP